MLFLQCNTPIVMDWKEVPPIPPRSGMEKQFGLAGPVAGAHENRLMVAGGANFEQGMPWRGGVKTYHDDIYLLEEKADGTFAWEVSESKLPFPVAYPACVTTKNGFVSVGGENEKGPLGSVFHFSFADGKVQVTSLPGLPQPTSSAGAALIGHHIYVAGGLDKNGATAACYALSLPEAAKGWERLPDLPEALSHAVVVAQNDGNETALYVIGGRYKHSEISTFLSTVYKFAPSTRQWSKEGDVAIEGKLIQLSAGSGMAWRNNHIILLGGDRGFFFNQTERMNLEIEVEKDATKKDSLLERKDIFLSHHPGFSKQILAYDTFSKQWTEIGRLPGESPATTVAFAWQKWFAVASGEVRPGVRTDKVLLLEME